MTGRRNATPLAARRPVKYCEAAARHVAAETGLGTENSEDGDAHHRVTALNDVGFQRAVAITTVAAGAAVSPGATWAFKHPPGRSPVRRRGHRAGVVGDDRAQGVTPRFRRGLAVVAALVVAVWGARATATMLAPRWTGWDNRRWTCCGLGSRVWWQLGFVAVAPGDGCRGGGSRDEPRPRLQREEERALCRSGGGG